MGTGVLDCLIISDLLHIVKYAQVLYFENSALRLAPLRTKISLEIIIRINEKVPPISTSLIKCAPTIIRLKATVPVKTTGIIQKRARTLFFFTLRVELSIMSAYDVPAAPVWPLGKDLFASVWPNTEVISSSLTLFPLSSYHLENAGKPIIPSSGFTFIARKRRRPNASLKPRFIPIVETAAKTIVATANLTRTRRDSFEKLFTERIPRTAKTIPKKR